MQRDERIRSDGRKKGTTQRNEMRENPVSTSFLILFFFPVLSSASPPHALLSGEEQQEFQFILLSPSLLEYLCLTQEREDSKGRPFLASRLALVVVFASHPLLIIPAQSSSLASKAWESGFSFCCSGRKDSLVFPHKHTLTRQ